MNKTGNVTTDSNASVENWFRIVKHNIFDTDSRLKAADFIRLININIDDRIAAFVFGISSLASKVFKHVFPRTVIIYRNVNDYVVKSKMRTKGT